jgi:hypothetical protein
MRRGPQTNPEEHHSEYHDVQDFDGRKGGLAMKTATLKQFEKTLNVILGKIHETPSEQLQRLLESGALSDVFEANFEGFDREAFRKLLGLKPLNPPLLIPVGTATMAATEEPIVLTAEVLRERYNIKWRGSNFDAWYLGRTLASFGGSTLAYKKLSRRSVDGPIIAELGGTLPARTELVEILSLVKAQKYGPKSKSGPLLTDGSANISYVEDEIRFPEDESVAYTNEAGQKVVLRAVYARWDDDGWNVNANAVTYPRTWNDDRRVFSRDSRLPSAA